MAKVKMRSKMKKIRFYHKGTNKSGCVWVKEITCAKCKKEIHGKFVFPFNSFDMYHPSCYGGYKPCWEYDNFEVIDEE